MSARQTAAISIAPIFLRLTLALTFLWAGLGKLQATIKVSGDDAAALANMGVLDPSGTGEGPGAQPPRVVPPSAPTPVPPVPAVQEPQPQSSARPATPTKKAPAQAKVSGLTPVPPAAAKPVVTPPKATQVQPQLSPMDSSEPDPRAISPTTSRPDPTGLPPAMALRSGEEDPKYTSANFPQPRNVKRMYDLALKIRDAAVPKARSGSEETMRLWPESLAGGRWPVYFAWAATLTEIAAGLFLLVGLFTRISAFSLACVMLTAMWLTEIGPAIAMGNTRLGFLPGDRDIWDVPSWARLMWQLALLGASLALLFAGPGAFSFDRVLFGAPKGGGGDDEE